MRGHLATKLRACRLTAKECALTLIWGLVVEVGAQPLVVKHPKVHCTTWECYRGTTSM